MKLYFYMDEGTTTIKEENRLAELHEARNLSNNAAAEAAEQEENDSQPETASNEAPINTGELAVVLSFTLLADGLQLALASIMTIPFVGYILSFIIVPGNTIISAVVFIALFVWMNIKSLNMKSGSRLKKWGRWLNGGTGIIELTPLSAMPSWTIFVLVVIIMNQIEQRAPFLKNLDKMTK